MLDKQGELQNSHSAMGKVDVCDITFLIETNKMKDKTARKEEKKINKEQHAGDVNKKTLPL